MTYAGQRTILDADSHVMELPGFLDDFIEPAQRGRLNRDGLRGRTAMIDNAVAEARARSVYPERAARARERLLLDKGWHAMGAFDPVERSSVLDLLGFDGQLVFATFAPAMFLGPDLDRLYAGSAAQNKAVARFCAADSRLLTVAFVPMADPARAAARPGLPQQRHAGHRPPGRRREHPLQGLPGHSPLTADLPRHLDPRWP